MDLAHALVAYALPAALITMLPGPDTAMALAMPSRQAQRRRPRGVGAIGTGLLMPAPKLGVFFVVVPPQFVPAGGGPASRALARSHAGQAVLCHLLLGRLAGAADHVLARRRVQVRLDRVTAAVFLLRGLRLAAETRSSLSRPPVSMLDRRNPG